MRLPEDFLPTLQCLLKCLYLPLVCAVMGPAAGIWVATLAIRFLNDFHPSSVVEEQMMDKVVKRFFADFFARHCLSFPVLSRRFLSFLPMAGFSQKPGV